MTKDAQENRVLAALSYVLFLWILALGKKDSAFCQFHARQGIVVFIAWVIVSFLGWVPFAGWAASVLLLVVTILAIWKTINGETWKIPWLGGFAERLKI